VAVVTVPSAVGDAGLGLEIASGRLEAGEGADFLLARHRLPEPRVALAEAVRANATACIDVSDGLVADAGHVAEASGLGLRVDLETLPLSAPARAWLGIQGDPAQAAVFLATAGDDYELACAVPEDRAEAFAAACVQAGTYATAVGRFGEGEGVTVLHHGSPVRVERAGFTHF
jgi:thiamine-monophosphate kinase